MERRRKIRIPFSTKVMLRHGDREIVSQTANASEGGMFVSHPDPLSVGERVRFTLEIREGIEIEGTARVVWSQIGPVETGRPVGNGLEYRELDEDSRALLTEAIREHLEHQPMVGDRSLPASSG